MPESKARPPEPPEQEEVEEVDESSDESFPASDPPSWAMGKRAETQPDAPVKDADPRGGQRGDDPPAKSRPGAPPSRKR